MARALVEVENENLELRKEAARHKERAKGAHRKAHRRALSLMQRHLDEHLRRGRTEQSPQLDGAVQALGRLRDELRKLPEDDAEG
jgi:hypothetical protein